MIRSCDFRPAWWLPGAHGQTLWPALFRLKPRPALRRERVELPDGDFIDLDWTLGDRGPIVLILHGLEGSSDSGYARGLLSRVAACGWRGVVMHFRGCSGESNRLARSYNAGETRDLAYVVDWLRQRESATALACVGYSLGGNALLKWLGETGTTKISAAVAISAPFLLDAAAQRMRRGFSRLYQRHLLRHLRLHYRRKRKAGLPIPVSLREMARLRDFYAFDDKVTAPLHGFAGVQDYYRRCSCRDYLRGIRTPTLIIHALDDPFLLASAVPQAEELSDSTTLELSRHGGHVGFVSGVWPGSARYWLEQRIPAFLAEHWGGTENCKSQTAASLLLTNS
ncbi:MAG: hydrolase [Gammaproteobacteria bacterium]|nr:hydrolase [Gammaproteobacteria bacterium]MCP5424321.1 hydrolase [Gammaproteobacteria bacterium]